ncbi:hypothetical protein FRC02_007189 [Tulasnella sp. 418]|nr:hypothetical protein FRC02_007189 [Tulasnella sp. 418]
MLSKIDFLRGSAGALQRGVQAWINSRRLWLGEDGTHSVCYSILIVNPFRVVAMENVDPAETWQDVEADATVNVVLVALGSRSQAAAVPAVASAGLSLETHRLPDVDLEAVMESVAR